eukprot:6195204-Pleurochrysis_carterae.AAC.2
MALSQHGDQAQRLDPYCLTLSSSLTKLCLTFGFRLHPSPFSSVAVVCKWSPSACQVPTASAPISPPRA